MVYTMKFVSKLSGLSKSRLKIIKNSSFESNRIRTRAHAVILSSEGFAIKEIMKICNAAHKSISGWNDGWEMSGFDSLLDAPHTGRLSRIKTNQEEEVIKLVERNPRQLSAVAEEIKQEPGLSISKTTLKRFLKKKDFLGNALENL